ncbi:VOC family protein [Leifsonia sp. H3M29-4]|uniref:VOC family protein n=1 Tax=Salinibacterium metalliresistens TaxID=3031321 RepID=UPI0023D9EED4|nr:VOC family protein [Salinibacterium metalliresistens]MDF1479317.1 VOC family protein [Salinibacterium metalliresistens]
MRVDHVALEVADFDTRIAMLERLGMRVQRIGRKLDDPNRRIAMVGDGSGFKLELIEADTDGHSHIAFYADDLERTFAELTADDGGFAPVREPARLVPAKGDTAVVVEPGGLRIQLIRYDDDSTDL